MYSSEQLGQLYEGKRDVSQHIQETLFKCLALTPSLTDKAQEHCKYGICRRLLIVNECLNFFFNELPPEIDKEISKERRSRASIHLHAFLINICGIIDNMAWLWVYQSKLDDKFDIEEHHVNVGLFKEVFFYTPSQVSGR